jgi:hypothetical protein
MENITILPDAMRTLRGLANQGYTPPIAIADIVDNSIAAGATQVKIYFSQQPDDTYKVLIIDNGCGMSGDELKRAMQIGSGADMARTSLSVYGMGLKAGSLSFTDSFTVMTRNRDSEDIWAARIDMDMQAENPWTIQFGKVSGPVEADFRKRLPGTTGTIVVWERADFQDVEMDVRKMTVKAVSDAQEATELYLGLVFNRFISGDAEGYEKLSISVNDKEIAAFNPVSEEYLDEDWKPIVDHLTVKILTKEQGVVEIPYTMTTYMISDTVSKNESRLGMRDQGIFPYRQDRLLQPPEWLGVARFHPDLNVARVVLDLPPVLDSIIRTDMKKSGLALPQQMIQPMKERFDEYRLRMKRLKAQRREVKRKNVDTTKVHDKSNRVLQDASEYIEQPLVKFDSQGLATIDTRFGANKTELAQIFPNESSGARIETVNELEDGVLFEPRWNGAEAVIFLNKSHPFYQKVYFACLGDDLAIQGLDFLIHSMCHAELLTRVDRAIEQFRRMRYEMSMMLRQYVAELDTPGDATDRQLADLDDD